MEIYLTYLSALFSIPSLFLSIYLHIFRSLVLKWAWLSWPSRAARKKTFSFSILHCYTAILLVFNLFHLGFFLQRSTHSFDTSECYLTSFCLFRSGFCLKFVLSTHSLSFSFSVTFHLSLNISCHFQWEPTAITL